MATIFTKIINGEIPAHKIAEDDQHLAFLDINPLVEGHTLVIPKREVDYYFDLDREELAALNAFAKKVAAGLKQAIDCKRVGIAVIGLEVPHVHMHLVPLNNMEDINFTRQKLSPTQEQLAETAKKIGAAV